MGISLLCFLPTNSNEKATVFNKYTIKDAPNPRYVEHWEGYCDEIFNFKALNPTIKSLNKELCAANLSNLLYS